MFITLDGPGGAGKSTLVSLVAAHLVAYGHDALATRQPSDAELGKLARHNTDTYHGAALACLVAADRYHHLEVVIRPALAEGRSVVCDRYVPSSYVLQQRDGVPLGFIRALNAEADRPDLAVLLTADPDLLEGRLLERGGHSRFAIVI
jgi:dTMP kinase